MVDRISDNNPGLSTTRIQAQKNISNLTRTHQPYFYRNRTNFYKKTHRNPKLSNTQMNLKGYVNSKTTKESATPCFLETFMHLGTQVPYIVGGKPASRNNFTFLGFTLCEESTNVCYYSEDTPFTTLRNFRTLCLNIAKNWLNNCQEDKNKFLV